LLHLFKKHQQVTILREEMLGGNVGQSARAMGNQRRPVQSKTCESEIAPPAAVDQIVQRIGPTERLRTMVIDRQMSARIGFCHPTVFAGEGRPRPNKIHILLRNRHAG
jgi:hypothetical protein